MSTASPILPMAIPLISRPVRAFFAPVNRVTGTPTIFDPAANSAWTNGKPPGPWIDLGCITDFKRSSESKIVELDAGVPAAVRLQARQKLGATVSLHFGIWSKLSMALASGSQHMNLLVPASASAAAIGSGAKAAPAMLLGPNSTASTLYIANPSSAGVQAGSLIAVDQDFVSQSGFVGSAVSAAYVKNASSIGSDPDYIRRVSFNVGRIVAIGSDGGFQLATPLLAGAPTPSMKVQRIVGFVDREGGSFFQEWSGLFVINGVQGDRLCFYYPRLQTYQSSGESLVSLAPLLDMVQISAQFRALPITDGNDSEQVVCYRSYFPGSATYV